jgi:hypothetical protein
VTGLARYGEAELPRFAFLEPFKEMLSAERYIAIVAGQPRYCARGRNGSAFSIDGANSS